MADLQKTPYWPGDRGSAENMDDELWVRINWARRKSYEQYNRYIILVSGCRTLSEQIALRIQNCGGNTHYNIWQKPSGDCNPPTAIPGTSNHGKDPCEAADLSPGPRSLPGVKDIFAEAGLVAKVVKEDWHYELAPNRGPLPDEPTPAPTPPEEDDVTLPNDFFITHRDRGVFLVNGVTKLASHVPTPACGDWIKSIYALVGQVVEDHTADVEGGTALIDCRLVNVVATQ